MFDMRWGGFGRLLYRRLMAGAFRGIIRTISLNMKAYYESQADEPVNHADIQAVGEGQ